MTDADTIARGIAERSLVHIFGSREAVRDDMDNIRYMTNIIAAALREYGEACIKEYLKARGQMPLEEQVQKLQALDLDRVNQIAKADAEGYRRGVESAREIIRGLEEQLLKDIKQRGPEGGK